jgi:hypothetical protein
MENKIRVLGKQQVHIIFKKEHHTFSDGDKIDPLIIKIKYVWKILC